MKAEIKYFHSPDVYELEKYVPIENDNFGFLLELEIGIVGKDGADLFNIMLCTPKWLINNNKNDEIIFGRHHLIVFEYNYQKIYKTLNDYISNIDCENWEEIANIISRIAHWEFEDYKE